MMLFYDLRFEMIDHAEEAFPEECLGVVVDGKYVRLQNVSPDPEASFEMREEDELKYIFPDSPAQKAQALVHSHPDGPLWPSDSDMRAQIEGGLPFVMIGHSEETGWDYWEVGDHMLDVPLLERKFRHGVADCYDAARSWFWQESKGGILLQNFPRRNYWWMIGEAGEMPLNLYADNFMEAGFRQLSEKEIKQGLRRGDCFLFKLNPSTSWINANMVETHAGVYLGNGQIYHHLPNRLSTYDNAEQWGRKASRWLRYEGEGAELIQ
jgi:proteasome lid subunit RPN8/RPN11